MNIHPLKYKSEKRLFDGYFKIDEAIFERVKKDGTTIELKRCKLSRPDAVAAIVYNRETQKVILVKQNRYPINHKISENIYEIVAGKIDGDEKPVIAIQREILEEIGYDVSEAQIVSIGDMITSPGYTTETIYLFYVEVKEKDKVSDGGGLESENEDVEVCEIGITEFFSQLREFKITDSKTVIAGLRWKYETSL